MKTQEVYDYIKSKGYTYSEQPNKLTVWKKNEPATTKMFRGKHDDMMNEVVCYLKG